MNTKLYIETIKKECTFLEKEGYIFTLLENNIYYSKKNNSEGFRISFSWSEYGDKFTTQGLTAKKRFNIVENEIKKILTGELEDYYTIHKTLSTNYIPKELEFKEVGNNICFPTNTVENIKLFSQLLKIFYSKTVLEFFKYYEHISAIDNKLEELLELKKIQSILTSSGNSAIHRFYIISFICENNPIKNFFIETYFPYLKDNLDNELNKIELEKFKILQRNLE